MDSLVDFKDVGCTSIIKGSNSDVAHHCLFSLLYAHTVPGMFIILQQTNY